MNYRHSEMKIDQLVAYLNDDKINLSPAFQRGHVWKPLARKKLLKNIIQKKPIPAVFLYKEASGSRYSYNILDGKQRLESIILFIGDARADVKIKDWRRYFFGPAQQTAGGFAVESGATALTFTQLPDDVVRDFREYAIPTIEITLDEESSLDEIITLFVDINQQGEAVKRFDIVKAMCLHDPLLRSVFDLVAEQQRRGHDIFYRSKNNEFTAVLKRLQVIEAVAPQNAKVDKMWERLLEFGVFLRERAHRRPVDILKEFMGAGQAKAKKLTKVEIAALRRVFKLVRSLTGAVPSSRLFTDQTHFYTLVTTLLNDGANDYSDDDLAERLTRLGAALEKPPTTGKLASLIKKYLELSARQTTDVSKRGEREKVFREMLTVA